MRRITMWALSTVSALVLLFSYHTSTSSSAAGVVALGSINGVGPGAASGGAAGAGAQTPAPSASTPSATASPKASTKATTKATPTPTPTKSSSGGSSGSSSSSSRSSGSGTAGSASGSTKAPSSAPSGTFTGASVMTQYGPVQVQITVSNGQITRSAVTQVPWNSPQDQQINSYAVPILNQEVVQAQSAQIDMISGATFTSYGYLQSLQSAIDQAHL